ncbi:glycosylphosphatidylinositol anchor attachment 1 protein-like isoform X1 [Zingiber officinale]|uniref:glycosylphosphatidylinositol anchor attachment 1 protein-like isoform X1 n=1 Tax=Zingiber officinale TaxID=94328 RepID=UPI001C4C8F98|nr:glycosylphosphatidylinositol anchor attachment 1 protein-like isoform X1 [Zingiber officinale]
MAVKEEGDTSQQGKKSRSRLILRLGALLVAHSGLVSVVCCAAGIIAFILLPVLANNTYISENALMPGSADPAFSSQEVLDANRLTMDILNRGAAKASGIEIAKLLREYIVAVGAESYYHKFVPRANKFHPLHFFSSTTDNLDLPANPSCGSFILNAVGIIRAPRGDGKETIVLVTPYNSQNTTYSDAVSLGIGFSIFSLLSHVTWLAKDIVWLAADSRYGEYTTVDSWLKDYHGPAFPGETSRIVDDACFEENNSDSLDHIKVEGHNSYVYKRAGTMAAALVLKVVDKKEEERDSLSIYAEASNGQMPNLDLINIAHYLAVHRQGLRVKIGSIIYFLKASWVKLLGEMLQHITTLAKRLNPKWKFDITSADYVEGTATLASSIYYQALGVPTGSHGAFRNYQVDAVTLEFSPRSSLNNENVRSAFLLKTGRLIEGVIRSVNNLLEKFHQSFFLYFLTAPHKYVSVGIYMIPFGILIAPLPIVAAALFSSNNGSSNKDGSWKWLQAAKVVFLIHLWAMITSLLPYVLLQLPLGTPSSFASAWAAVAICFLLITYLILWSSSIDCGWELLKSVMIVAAAIGLSLMSVINFSTAQIGAMLIVPMCLLVKPARKQTQGVFAKALMLTSNLALLVVAFPPAALLIAKTLFGASGNIDIGDFWEWAQILWSWNSATYMYLLWIHLPCWVLCLNIFLYPCIGSSSKA